MVLICISLLISGVEHLFMCLCIQLFMTGFTKMVIELLPGYSGNKNLKEKEPIPNILIQDVAKWYGMQDKK